MPEISPVARAVARAIDTTRQLPDAQTAAALRRLEHTLAAPASRPLAVPDAALHAIAATHHLESPAATTAVRQAADGAKRLNVAILQGLPEPLERSLLARELDALGARHRFLEIDQTWFTPDGVLHHGAEAVTGVDAVIARNMSLRGLELLTQMEQQGLHVVNRPSAIFIGRDKISMAEAFARTGVSHPPTIIVNSVDDAAKAVGELKLPVVIKNPNSAEGEAVWLARTRDEAEKLVERHLPAAGGDPLIAQKFLPEAAGADIRALVIRNEQGKNEFLVAMKRTAAEGEFRANIALGGTGEQVDLTPQQRALAIRAADSAGLDVTGVDLTVDGRTVIEINPSPGIPDSRLGLSGPDSVAGRIAAFAVSGARSSR